MKQKIKLTIIILCSALFLTGSIHGFYPNTPVTFAIPGESAGHTNY